MVITHDSPDSPGSISPEKKNRTELSLSQALTSLPAEVKKGVLNYVSTLKEYEDEDEDEEEPSMLLFFWNTVAVNDFLVAARHLRDLHLD